MRLIRTTENDNFYLMHEFQNNTLSLHVTNFKSLWSQKLVESEVISRFQYENPAVEASDDYILQCVQTVLGKGTCDITLSEQELALKARNDRSVQMGCLSPVALTLKYSLELRPPSEFYTKVTVPLILLVNELRSQQKTLCDVISSKDLEIAQYKLEGAVISRKSVITEVFNEETFKSGRIQKLRESNLNLVNPVVNFSGALNSTVDEIFRRATCGIKTETEDKAKETATSSTKKPKRPPGAAEIVQFPRLKRIKKKINL